MAIEIVDFPSKNGGSFHRQNVTVHQRDHPGIPPWRRGVLRQGLRCHGSGADERDDSAAGAASAAGRLRRRAARVGDDTKPGFVGDEKLPHDGSMYAIYANIKGVY